MGNSFLVVNPARREFIDPWCFGDNEKTTEYMQGLHPTAVAMLVCPAVFSSTTGLEGSWNGDEIVVATEAASPDQDGFTTASPQAPDRNLYRLVLDEFRDISYFALAMVCERSKDIADDLARQARLQYDHDNRKSTSLLMHLGNCVTRADCCDLNYSLIEHFGKNWKDIYESQ